MSDKNTGRIKSNFQPHHLELMEEDAQELGTIYQLRASMSKKLSPQSQESSSPEAARELRSLLQRLVEMDTESRELIKRVFSMLEKDDRLERYMKERIADPRFSQMWRLIEQVLAAQDKEERSNFDELDMTGCACNPTTTDKAIKGDTVEETKPDRFKVKNLITIHGGEQETKTTTTTSSPTTTSTTSDQKSNGN